MYIPVIKKLLYSNDVLIERVLPYKGKLTVSLNDIVEPFNKLGMCKVSYKVINLGNEIALNNPNKRFFYAGEVVGKRKSKKIIAPYDCFLAKDHEKYVLKEEEKPFWLLSGVWGKVAGVYGDKSVLLRTQTLDIHLVACGSLTISGELVVFPNPSQALEVQYLEKLEKVAAGKIVYVGSYANTEIFEKAVSFGVAGILAGGADKEVFTFAKRYGVFLGVFSGFGDVPTPHFIFDILKNVSNRYVFVFGQKNLLRIPLPEKSLLKVSTAAKKVSAFKALKKGLQVQVLEDPYFGYIGMVDSVKGSSIFVKLLENKIDDKKVIEVSIPNFLAIE